MAGDELGRVFLEVDESGHDTAEVAETDVHGDTDTALGGATDVVAVPGDTLRDVGVDARGHEEDTGVLDVRVLRCDLHDQAENGGDGEADHEDATSAETVGHVTTGDAAEAGNDVRGHAHELSLLVAVAKSLDNGGKEQRETVQGSVDAAGTVSQV